MRKDCPAGSFSDDHFITSLSQSYNALRDVFLTAPAMCAQVSDEKTMIARLNVI